MNLRRWWASCWLVGLLALASGPALAARFVVVLSSDAAPYRELYATIQSRVVDAGHSVVAVTAQALGTTPVLATDLVVTVGVEAAEAYARQAATIPVLAVLVPRGWYLAGGADRLGAQGRRPVSAIFLDQSPARQAALIRAAFPTLSRVGMLTSMAQPMRDALIDALREAGLTPVSVEWVPGESLIETLKTVLADSDVLLALPDPQILNPDTAQSLLLTAYRYRDPVIGYSRSLTRAGAMVSLHSSPAEIGLHTAQWLLFFAAARVLPAPAYPRYYGVSINSQVAGSLGLRLPDEALLLERLRDVP